MPRLFASSACRATFASLLFAVFATVLSGADGHDRSGEIEHLLRFVERLEGATFIRNGGEHTCKEAESHMRLKWSRQRERIKSADHFVELCATKSSVSGKRYQIRFADGEVRDSAEVLLDELRRFRVKQSAA